MLTGLDSTELQSKLDLAAKALPIKSPFRQTLASMSTLVNRHKVAIEELEFIKQNEGLGIEMTMVGPYSNIYSFLENVENSLPLASINAIEINAKYSSLDDARDRSYSAKLNLSFYFQPAPKTFGKLAEKLPVISAVGEKSLRELQGFEFFDLQSEGVLSLDVSGRAPKLFPD